MATETCNFNGKIRLKRHQTKQLIKSAVFDFKSNDVIEIIVHELMVETTASNTKNVRFHQCQPNRKTNGVNNDFRYDSQTYNWHSLNRMTYEWLKYINTLEIVKCADCLITWWIEAISNSLSFYQNLNDQNSLCDISDKDERETEIFIRCPFVKNENVDQTGNWILPKIKPFGTVSNQPENFPFANETVIFMTPRQNDGKFS